MPAAARPSSDAARARATPCDTRLPRRRRATPCRSMCARKAANSAGTRWKRSTHRSPAAASSSDARSQRAAVSSVFDVTRTDYPLRGKRRRPAGRTRRRGRRAWPANARSRLARAPGGVLEEEKRGDSCDGKNGDGQGGPERAGRVPDDADLKRQKERKKDRSCDQLVERDLIPLLRGARHPVRYHAAQSVRHVPRGHAEDGDGEPKKNEEKSFEGVPQDHSGRRRVFESSRRETDFSQKVVERSNPACEGRHRSGLDFLEHRASRQEGLANLERARQLPAFPLFTF